jgi:hypothetical protein
MTDIVDRLRAIPVRFDLPEVYEAANAIVELRLENTRLRAALVRLANPEWGEYPSDEMILQAVVSIARAALKGTP